MKNSLSDLNNHLFTAIKRLNEEDLSEDKLEQEIKRSKAIALAADRVVDNARLSLKAAQFNYEIGNGVVPSEALGIEKKR